MSVLLVSADLMTTSRTTAAYAATGHACVTTMNGATAVDKLEPTTKLVLVDLSAPGLRIAELVAAVRASTAREASIVAFGPHVHEGLLAAAREAGCDVVTSRGEFFARLPPAPKS